ncbi:hypothetical protein EXIGLDRAFT_772644 [Exidia glandulosa HHB12029]|uniref:Uncharacterized protein n=1 Tax=Exidia glandulosa HHB12029 TaxID=1314781 RepID=A0A165F7L1_EXIGL|nr:hypothetical protein EXIGLDRAFT_772644 [Exidia glandulosa HHB12029]
MANVPAPFNITAERATAIAAEMLVVVCGGREVAMAGVAYAFFATLVYAAYTYTYRGGRVSHTACIILCALAAVWTHLAAPPPPTPTVAA